MESPVNNKNKYSFALVLTTSFVDNQPLFFRALHTTGNRELFGRCRSTAWHHIHSALQMLHEEIAKSRKPLTRFYGITASESVLPPLKTDTSTSFNVSNRTISRWENGNNMPDLDSLPPWYGSTEAS